MKKRLYLFDTTLRDGAQTLGVDFSVEDKLLIAQKLDALGIDYIEGGYPGANPVDTAFFEAPPKLAAKFAAFGMTKRAGRSTSNDPGFQAVVQAKADAVVPRRQILGLPCASWRSASRWKKTWMPSRASVEAVREPRQGSHHRLRALLRRL